MAYTGFRLWELERGAKLLLKVLLGGFGSAEEFLAYRFA